MNLENHPKSENGEKSPESIAKSCTVALDPFVSAALVSLKNIQEIYRKPEINRAHLSSMRYKPYYLEKPLGIPSRR